jgi:hypothetical protein
MSMNNHTKHITKYQSYDENDYANDSIQSDSEISDSEFDISLSSPPDIILLDEDKIDDSESIHGIHSDHDDNLFTIIRVQESNIGTKYWSAIATMEEMIKSEGININSSTFQIFIDEMIKDKCWNDKDLHNFIEIMTLLTNIVKNIDDANNLILELIINPNYFNIVVRLIDDLDTINALCALGTDKKCDLIVDKNKREYVYNQITLIEKLVDIYMPVFARMLIMIEKFLNDNNKIDSKYIISLEIIKTRIMGIIYMREMKKIEMKKIEMSRLIINKNEIHEINKKESDNSNYILMFLLLVVICVIIYMLSVP